MEIESKNNLYLSGIEGASVNDGLSIKIKLVDDSSVTIAYIFWSVAFDDCYIQTERDNLQKYIFPNNYSDFIYLVDEAYDIMYSINK